MEAAGLLGDTEVAQEILGGTYVPPPGTNEHTTITMIQLLKHMEVVAATGLIDISVERDDFISY